MALAAFILSWQKNIQIPNNLTTDKSTNNKRPLCLSASINGKLDTSIHMQ